MVKVKKAPPRALLRLLAVLLVITATVIWAYLNPDTTLKIKQKLMRSAMIPLKKEASILEIRLEHPLCGHTEIKRINYQSKERYQAELRRISDYRVLKGKGDRLIYVCKGSDLCDSCQNHFFMGISGEKVVIFRGTPAKRGPVMEATDITAKLLPKVEKIDLEKGIPVKDDKEKLQLIEGLHGLIVN